MTDYRGIDYGLGKANVDTATGIRYGVISQRSITHEALDDIFFGPHSKDLAYENWLEEIKSGVRSALSDFMSARHVNNLAEHVLEWDGLGDAYNGDEGHPRYDDGDYVIETCLDSDLVVLKSPFYTYAQFCSPCVPGAGNLDNPIEEPHASDIRVFCLGAGWFEGDKAPYRYWLVEDDKEGVCMN